MKPASLTSSVCWGTLANMRCVWASIRPGMRVRPPPWIRVTLVPAGAAMGAVEIDRMVLPTTRTLAAGESRSDVPLKMRTFSNSTPEGWGVLGTCCCLLHGADAHEEEDERAERAQYAMDAALHGSSLMLLLLTEVPSWALGWTRQRLRHRNARAWRSTIWARRTATLRFAPGQAVPPAAFVARLSS
jgi:hypothetical protein